MPYASGIKATADHGTSTDILTDACLKFPTHSPWMWESTRTNSVRGTMTKLPASCGEGARLGTGEECLRTLSRHGAAGSTVGPAVSAKPQLVRVSAPADSRSQRFLNPLCTAITQTIS